ncbi:Mrp/NBP35 family ATP-binding protein [Xylanivirga thermophila]|jgi:ATP-binding protein involved in chromosome partitioning|uniref:Mrp/NBP35 family ATP-binding protein n=1 Tax=Xylanivirga thermophila TaxID=2496273 RepID=UPI00101C289D|nr:Mrp/NBP35 family ATP-binding protein [Xylanivirga thermophila]
MTQGFEKLSNKYGNIKNVIAIMSGKGGVGKSSVTALTAVFLRQKGYKVAILDADVTGPSIPKLFGLRDKARGTETAILPSETATGIKVMSTNLLLDAEDQPVIWRGPIIAGVIKQFYEDVMWGDVDFMLVDLPPGTGDVPLTVMQSLPLDGIIVVSSPQQLVDMIVKKAIHMAQDMNVPILGIVENMSYIKCPKCGEEISLFGKSTAPQTANNMGIPFLGGLPILPDVAELSDEGRIELVNNIHTDFFEEIGDKLIKSFDIK